MHRAFQVEGSIQNQSQMKTKRIKIGIFLIENKNWVDLGQLSDFKKASENFE